MDATITQNVEAAVERIQTEGFAVIPNLIDRDRLARLSDDSEALSWLRQIEGHYCGLPQAELHTLPDSLRALL